MKRIAREIVVMLALMATVYGPAFAGQAAKEKPLFDRLGGKKAITAVVDEFVARVAADNRINRYFSGVGLGRRENEDVQGEARRSDLPGQRRALQIHRQ